ncbi:MAG: hypothetical protein AAGE18_15195 [Pseudomonadota bacterium]
MPISDIGAAGRLLRFAAMAPALLVVACTSQEVVETEASAEALSNLMTLQSAGAEILVAGPGSYCTLSGDGGGEVLGTTVRAGRCTVDVASAATARGARRVDGIFAATVAAGALPGSDTAALLTALETHFHSSSGRALVALGKNTDGVRVRQSRIIDNALFLLVEDDNAPEVAGMQRAYWRAFLAVDGHLVALTAGARSAGPDANRRAVDSLILRRYVEAMVAATRAVNA